MRISSRRYRIRKGLSGSPEKHLAKKKKALFLDKPLLTLHDKIEIKFFLAAKYGTRRCGHNQSITFLEDIKPFMLIPYKINQVKIALERMEEGSDARYPCKICEADFASPSGRRRHFKNFHENTDASS